MRISCALAVAHAVGYAVHACGRAGADVRTADRHAVNVQREVVIGVRGVVDLRDDRERLVQGGQAGESIAGQPDRALRCGGG